MIYRDEFTRLKKIYNRMPEAQRLMIGPMLGLSVMVMALYGLALLPFGYASFGMVLLIGALGTGLSGLMIAATMDIGALVAAWRAASAPKPAAEKPLPDPVTLRQLSIANDPDKPSDMEGGEETTEVPIQWQNP